MIATFIHAHNNQDIWVFPWTNSIISKEGIWVHIPNISFIIIDRILYMFCIYLDCPIKHCLVVQRHWQVNNS
jgi:hypothetical protein